MGSDPWTYPAVPEAASILRQSVLNKAIGIFEHEGCQERLAGPHNSKSSPASPAMRPPLLRRTARSSIMGTNAPASFGFTGICDSYSQDNVNYFQNMVPPPGYHGGESLAP